MSKWIKKGDQVLVTTGNDKGRIGAVVSRNGDRVVVKSINLRKKHVKSKNRTATQGIIEKEMPIHVSNVVLCNAEGNPIYVKPRPTADGKGKELFYLDGKEAVVHRQLKKEATH